MRNSRARQSIHRHCELGTASASRNSAGNRPDYLAVPRPDCGRCQREIRSLVPSDRGTGEPKFDWRRSQSS